MSSSGRRASPYDAKNISIEDLEGGKWIKTRRINYQDPKGQHRVWEMAVRTTRTVTTGVDAVSIATFLNHPKKPKEILLVKQFRPPIGKVVIEMPAGLIDPNESIESTSVRELMEETGYHGTFKRKSSVIYSDPGLTNANMVIAYVDVDLTDPKNINPQPQLEDGEFIDVFTLPVDNLLVRLECLMKEESCTVDARLYHFAVGIDFGKSL